MNYQKLEQNIVDRLEPLRAAGIDVVVLPENDKDYDRPFKVARVTVAYKMSLFNDDGFNGRPMIFSTSNIVQKETAELEVLIQARGLHGANGVHYVADAVAKRIIGFEPEDWGRIYRKEYRFVEHADGIWTYSMSIHTQGLSVQLCDPTNEPLITQITTESSIMAPISVDNSIATAPGLLKFKESGTISVQFTLTENGQPKDLTGYTFRFGIKQFLGDPVPLIVKPGTATGNTVSAVIPAVENVLLSGQYKGIFEMISAGNIENEIVVSLIIEPQLI